LSSPTDGVFDALNDEEKTHVQFWVAGMLEAFDGGDWNLARDMWIEAQFTSDEAVAVFGFLDSKQRAFLKGDNRKYLNDEQ